MRSTARVLYGFFSSFGIPAYVTNGVPKEAEMPYITYDVVEPEPLSTSYFTASVWYRDSSYESAIAKADEIRDEIGRGISIQAGNGAIRIYQEDGGRFAQIVNDPNPETKRVLLSMLIQCNTTD